MRVARQQSMSDLGNLLIPFCRDTIFLSDVNFWDAIP